LPVIKGERKPETPEELMRSRYAAYVLGEVDYIIESVHPDERKDVDRKTTEIWSRKAKWDRLEIISTSGGGENDEKGEVEFKAHFEMNGLKQSHHEKAEFARHNGRWYFVEGEQVAQAPVVREGPRIGRNDACPCGSGKKYKKCCGKAA
jgi:SEC-C motif-containing protein